MVALIDPIIKHPPPTQLGRQWSKKEPRISENGASSKQSDAPDQ